jgi:hypothetical protein
MTTTQTRFAAFFLLGAGCSNEPTTGPVADTPPLTSVTAVSSANGVVPTSAPTATPDDPGDSEPPPRVHIPSKITCGSATCNFPSQVCCLVSDEGRKRAPRGVCVDVESPAVLENTWNANILCADEAVKKTDEKAVLVLCDSSSECAPTERCGAFSDNGTTEWIECTKTPDYLEVCTETGSSCKTANTRCQKRGETCPFSGGLCDVVSTCRPTRHPQCGSARCTDASPYCCTEKKTPYCGARCPKPDAFECTNVADCGGEMKCCVTTTLRESSFCAHSCPIPNAMPACASDADCPQTAGKMTCGADPNPKVFGMRLCE